MASIPLIASASVILNASGNGQVSLGPSIPGTIWYPDGATCQVATDTSTPVFLLYLNTVGAASYQGGSETGNNDACSISSVTLYPGMVLIGVWAGGDAGSMATMNITGTQTIPGQ